MAPQLTHSFTHLFLAFVQINAFTFDPFVIIQGKTVFLYVCTYIYVFTFYNNIYENNLQYRKNNDKIACIICLYVILSLKQIALVINFQSRYIKPPQCVRIDTWLVNTMAVEQYLYL